MKRLIARRVTEFAIVMSVLRGFARRIRGPSAAPALADREDLLQATLAHAETQLLAQIADETSLDGRTMGILAFNGALLAADIAAKDLLGPLWWTPLIVVAVATLPCLRSTVTKDTDLGPLALTFYATYGALPANESREQLLADLGYAFDVNAGRVKAKRYRLRIALTSLVVGLIIASITISVDRPTTLKDSNGQGNTATSSAAPPSPGTRAGSVAAAARGAKRRHQ